jgi:hypothetical protein
MRSQTFTKENRGGTEVHERFSAIAESGEIYLSLGYRQGGMVMWVTAEKPNVPLYAAHAIGSKMDGIKGAIKAMQVGSKRLKLLESLCCVSGSSRRGA